MADTIDIDDRGAESGRQDLLMAVRQAGQLAVAVRSPVASEEDQKHPCIQVVAECPGLAGLVLEGKVG